VPVYHSIRQALFIHYSPVHDQSDRVIGAEVIPSTAEIAYVVLDQDSDHDRVSNIVCQARGFNIYKGSRTAGYSDIINLCV